MIIVIYSDVYIPVSGNIIITGEGDNDDAAKLKIIQHYALNKIRF